MQKLVGYAVAGGILLLIADVAPTVAAGTAGLILFGVVLTHSDQLTVVSKWIQQATKG